jgi:subtilisin family serine protease
LAQPFQGALNLTHFTHETTQVHQVHSKLHLNGTGIRVGIIDTGIDKNHPALKDKIVIQRSFVNDTYGDMDW